MSTKYIVVGAGSAGCVLADRLSEDGSEVLLLEAGPPDWHPMIHIPAGVLKLLADARVNWNFSSEPEEGTAGRRIHWPRGRVLGGSSAINGMLYVRGNAADYDTWAQMGCRGWSYEEVLPFFRKSERFGDGDGAYRGRDGPLSVEPYRTVLPLTHAFVEAAQQVGFAYSEDLNGRDQEGVGYSQMTRNRRWRASTARAFLSRAKRRPNLRVVTNAMVTGLTLDRAGGRCTGVRYGVGEREREAGASREVILSGGAVNSPHLLQISGIGPADHLRDIGVEPVLHLPGVGDNLQDHYVVRITHRATGAVSINELARPPKLLAEIARWVIRGDGALTFGVTSAQVFCRSRDELASPDLQLLFTPASYDTTGFGRLERAAGMTAAVCPVRPQSRGSILAGSADPLAPPIIRPGYLSVADDYRVLLAGIDRVRRIFAAPALARYSAGETVPGTGVASEDDLKAFARNKGVTLYHPVGTCRMGEGAGAVVDARLRVHGMAGLRVVDASVMPTLTTGNTNAPTIMIGEKGASMIREDNAHGAD